MPLFRIATSLFALGVLLSQCATIQKLEEVSHTRSNPKYEKFQEEIPAPEQDPNDHKIRKKNKTVPDVVLVAIQKDWVGYSQSDRLFYQNEILRRLLSFGIRIHNKELLLVEDVLTLRPLMKKKDIDAYILIQPVGKDSDSGDAKLRDSKSPSKFNITIHDSVNNLVYENLTAEWKSQLPEESNSLIFWNHDKGIQLVPPIQNSIKELVYFPEAQDWKKGLDKSIHGSLNLYASSADTTVKINGVIVGEVPIQNYSVVNGPNKVEFSKPGLEPKIRYLQIRAGIDKSVIHEWDDDRTTSSLVVQSFPQGLDVWIDSERKGKTHQYMSEIIPGDYRIRLSKSFPQDRGVVQEFLFAEGVVKLRPQTLESVALPYWVEEALHPNQVELWRPVGKRGFVPGVNPKLSFGKKTKLLPGDYGYLSSYFYLDELVVQGTFPDAIPVNQSIAIAFKSPNRTFLLEAKGEEISFYELKSGMKQARSLGVWKFKEKIKPEERIFRFETHPKKKEIRFRLGNREIYKTEFLESGFAQIGLITRGESFFQGMPLRDLKIFYPDMIELEKKKENK
ncbi:MAG: hypothetical protein JJT78_02785 [Leptospira sp.]|nr:hypothetical protein [Leptospira sp.]